MSRNRTRQGGWGWKKYQKIPNYNQDYSHYELIFIIYVINFLGHEDGKSEKGKYKISEDLKRQKGCSIKLRENKHS